MDTSSTVSLSPSTTSTSASTPSCTTAIPGKYGSVPITACNSYYNAPPQFAAAVALAVLFGLLTVAHIAEAILFRKRYAWVIIMGASWETIAFSFHALGSHDQQMVAYATVYQLLFLLAPLWINAFVYMTFGRMVYYFLPDKKIAVIKATSLSRYFVIADIVSFLVQATGGIMASPGAGQSIIKIGLRVYEGGIGLQESFIVAFLMLMLLFRRRRLQNESCRSRDDAQTHTTGQEPQTRWRSLFYTLLATLVCISIRIFYRLAEWARGFSPVHNPVPFHEAYSYALDAFPMIGALLLLALYHPGRVLQGKHSEFPKKTRKQKKADKEARREARKKTKRPGVEAAL